MVQPGVLGQRFVLFGAKVAELRVQFSAQTFSTFLAAVSAVFVVLVSRVCFLTPNHAFSAYGDR